MNGLKHQIIKDKKAEEAPNTSSFGLKAERNLAAKAQCWDLGCGAVSGAEDAEL